MRNNKTFKKVPQILSFMYEEPIANEKTRTISQNPKPPCYNRTRQASNYHAETLLVNDVIIDPEESWC